MIVASEIIFSLIIALTISIIISLVLRSEGPRTGFFLLFLTIFLITLAGGLWLSPAGKGLYWLPFVVIGVLGSFILYLRAPRKPPSNRRETLETLDRIEEAKKLEKLTYMTFDLFFWIILVFLVAVILLHFLRKV